MAGSNEAARTFAWLAEEVVVRGTGGRAEFLRAWGSIRSSFLESGGRFVKLVDWLPDFWIARHTHQVSGHLAPVWGLTENLDSWPTFGVESIDRVPGHRSRSGQFDTLARILDRAPNPGPGDDEADAFLRLRASSDAQRDQAMCQSEQIKAWIGTALGSLLSAVPFTPEAAAPDDWDDNVLARLAAALEIASTTGRLAPEGDEDLDVLYNANLGEHGFSLDRSRIGQTFSWRYSWSWLGHHLEPDQMLESVQLAARLLRCRPLLSGLAAALTQDSVALDRLAICVLRRWMLTLEVLAWLEDALHREWRWVRTEDLATFAFNALKPAWPRPLVAISHRSVDAKGVLQGLGVWSSPFAAIDASYVPAWETNVGMIWGLFAATPVIVRVDSPYYADSLWCRREWEMAEHLAERCDFLKGRRIVDADVDDLPAVDDLVARAARARTTPAMERVDKNRGVGSPARFPPQSMVLVADALQRIDVLVLRAAGVIRILDVLFHDPTEVNTIVDLLVCGELPDMPAPTTNANAWVPYSAIFRDLAHAIGHAPDSGSPLRLAQVSDDAARLRDRALILAMPDFREGVHDVGDACAGIEWLRTFLTWYVEEDFGDHVVVDVRRATAERWETELAHSHQRGIVGLVTDTPVWVLQRAGQDADGWPTIGDWPLFTEYAASQYEWMMEVRLLSSWPLLYVGLAGLEVSDGLERELYRSIRLEDYPRGDSIGPRDVFGMEYPDFLA